ncbi:hypothetical protein ACJQWK_02640 [Exserohilum turcicum]
MLDSPLQLSIPATASRQHHPLTPFPFEPKPFVRQGKQAVRECHHSLVSIIDEEPSETHSQPALESSLAELPTEHAYDESSSNSEMAVSPPTTKQDSLNNATMHYIGIAPSVQSRAYAGSPILQARFNTLVRKASQLCAMSNSEVYLAVRHNGSFYIYNSVNTASHQAPEPEAHEQIVTVAVASSSGGVTV